MMMTKAFAPIAVAGTVAGGVLAAPAVHAAHIDVTLLADTAIFVGPTILSTPSPTFARTAADLFLEPLGFNAGDDPASCVIGVGDCDAPLQVLPTAALWMQGHSSFFGAAEIVQTVQAELAANPDTYGADNPLWVFGYSQGATAASLAMAQLAHDGVDTQSVHFVFIGNPLDANGNYVDMDPDPSDSSSDAWMLAGKETPDNLFPTTVYAIPGDPVPDASSTSEFGLFWEHMMYLGLTPDEVADHTATTDGMITNIEISGDFDHLQTWLNAWPHGLIDSGWWEGLFYSAVASIYNAFGNIEDFFGDWMGMDWSEVVDTMDFWFPLDV